MGQRVLGIGQEVGRNPREGRAGNCCGSRELPQLDEGARAEVSWEERGGPEPQLSSTSLPGSLTKPSTPAN